MKEILQLKNDFNCVKVLRGDILNVFEMLGSKLIVLKKIYITLLGLHNQSEHMFGIDSFYFQNKLIENEFDNLKDIQRYIENRMYCEYYQLHMLVQEYVDKEVACENVRNKIAVRKNYPAYKNLDPRRIYDFRLVAELQEHIIISIMELETYRQSKVAELVTDTAQSKLGLNIGNLVNSHRYYNALLNEKISMFIRYLQVFHEHHTKYFTRLHIKAKLIIGIINEDIQIKQFNPTGSSVVPAQVSDSPLSIVRKNLGNQPQTIKSFVKYEDSGDDLKAALDKIVSNIPENEDFSRGLYAPGNNTPSEETQDPQNVIISIGNPGVEDPVEHPDGGDLRGLYAPGNNSPSEETQEPQNVIIGNSQHESEQNIDVHSDSDITGSESQDTTGLDSTVSDYDEGGCNFSSVDVGRRVLVEGYDSVGTLRFVGKHHVKNVHRCGVEFDDNVGKNNGTVDDFTYFETTDNRGVIVAPRKVSFLDIVTDEL